MSQSLIATLGFLGGAVIALADGPRAVRLTGMLAGAFLAPAAASVGGWPGALVPIAAAVGVVVAGTGARAAAEHVRFVPGLDPQVLVVAPRDRLFGPRSVRALAAAAALVAASWVSLNVHVGGAATDQGAVFAVAYIWLVGAVRLLRGRAVEDLAIAAVAVALAGGVAWILETGPAALAEAATLTGLAPVAAAIEGWLAGRHGRRSPATEEP
jgi:hypothetical protein